MAKKKQKNQLNWHPNFRIESELPDIKIVRTDFIINGIAGFIALVLLVMFVSQELTLSSQKSTLENLETEVESLSQGNAANLKKSAAFKKIGPLMSDLERFYMTPIDPLEMVMQISKLTPESVLLTNLQLDEGVRTEKKKPYPTYKWRIQGVSPDLETITSIKNLVSEIEALQSYPVEVTENPSARDPATGFFSFQIFINIEPVFK